MVLEIDKLCNADYRSKKGITETDLKIEDVLELKNK